MPPPTTSSPTPSVAELKSKVAADEAALTAAENVPVPPPVLNPKTAQRALSIRRHNVTAQTVWWHDQGWAYTATGIPIAALTDDEVKTEADAQAAAKAALAAAKAKAAAPATAGK